MGGAINYDEAQLKAAYTVGLEVARQGKNLLTGATTGIPYAAALGARKGGALVAGISPAADAEEHVLKYRKPLDVFDFIAFTGVGYTARSSILVQSATGIIFVGGEFGTINEFSAAWICGHNVLGVMEGKGGVSDRLQEILSCVKTTWGSKVIFGGDPADLARRVCAEAEYLHAARSARLLADEIGADVRNMIELSFGAEDQREPCVTEPEHTLIGVLSPMSRP